MSNNEWYRFYAPRQISRLSAEQIAADGVAAERDLDFVLAQTDLRPADRILEIGCGWGRHSLALARRGFSAVSSIDIAPEPLAVARSLAAERDLACTFRQQDFMNVDSLHFQAILSLYDRSCCGFPSEAEDARALRHLADLLLPGGWLIFGINDWPFALPAAAQRWQEDAAGLELIEVVPDRVAMTCTDRVTRVPSGRRSPLGRRPEGTRVELTRRHYYLPELRRLLDLAGLDLCSAWHRLDAARPYGDGGDGLFIIARRRGGRDG